MCERESKLLSDEYFQLQRTVEEFDSKALTIKAWSVTISAAALVAAYVENVPEALLVGSGTAMLFWIAEALWKASQQAFYERVWEIELWMAGERDPKIPAIKPLQIARAWSKSWRAHGRNRHALRVMKWPHVFMPHAVIALAGVLLWLLLPPTIPAEAFGSAGR